MQLSENKRNSTTTRPGETASIRGRKASREVCFPFHNVVLSVKRGGRDSLPLTDKLPQYRRLTTQIFHATPAGEMLLGVFSSIFHNLNTHHIMKKIIKAIASIALLGALTFLGGEWPEETPRNKVIRYDAGALVTILVCGLYLRKEYEKEEKR